MDPSNLKLCEIQQEQLQEATQLLNKTFLQQNPLWINSHLNKDESLEITRQRVKRGLLNHMSTGVIDTKTNKLVMVFVVVDLYDYLKGTHKVPVKYQWQIPFSKNAKQLQSDFFQGKEIKMGESIFVDMTATVKQYAKKKSTLSFWIQAFRHYQKRGYKHLYSRATNPASSFMMVKVGSKIIKSAPVNFEDGKSVMGHLLTLDFSILNQGAISNL